MYKLINGLKTIAQGTLAELRQSAAAQNINVSACTLIDPAGNASIGATLYEAPRRGDTSPVRGGNGGRMASSVVRSF